MNILELFLKPLMPVLSKAVDVDVDPAKLGGLVLHLLGPEDNDEITAKKIDEAIVGGAAVEAIDGPVGKAYIKKLRAWAQDKSGA